MGCRDSTAGQYADRTHIVFRLDGLLAGRTAARDASRRQLQIILWDLASKRRVATIAGHRGLVISVRFSPDGRLLASCGIDGTVRLWDAATHQPIATLGSHEGAAYSVAFSPAGDRLISGGIDHVAKLWDIKTRQLITAFRGHASESSVSILRPTVRCGDCQPRRDRQIWDALVRADAAVFDRHAGNVASVSFSSDGRRLVDLISMGIE